MYGRPLPYGKQRDVTANEGDAKRTDRSVEGESCSHRERNKMDFIEPSSAWLQAQDSVYCTWQMKYWTGTAHKAKDFFPASRVRRRVERYARIPVCKE